MSSFSLDALKQGLINPEAVLYPETHVKDISISDLEIKVIESGFTSFDTHSILKQERSEVIIIAARPSVGKSALMFQLAEYVARSKPVYIFSLEMDKEQILTRMLSQIIGCTITQIQKNQISKDKIEAAKAKLSDLKLYINDKSGQDMNKIMNAARDAKMRLNIELIVIDYLQLVRKEKGHSTTDEVGQISSQMKELAKELRVPIIIGSQLSRACVSRGQMTGNYEPMLSDLRDSGSIEQDADIVMMLHRPAYFDQKADPHLAEVNIAKNRNGPTGKISMQYFGAQTKFVDESNII